MGVPFARAIPPNSKVRNFMTSACADLGIFGAPERASKMQEGKGACIFVDFSEPRGDSVPSGGRSSVQNRSRSNLATANFQSQPSRSNPARTYRVEAKSRLTSRGVFKIEQTLFRLSWPKRPSLGSGVTLKSKPRSYAQPRQPASPTVSNEKTPAGVG
jgi:hypothetical protein